MRLEVRGRVQGVGHRWFMVEQARLLALCGWVRNRRDGSVETTVASPPDAVDLLVAWARPGPRFAVVSAVDGYPGVDDRGVHCLAAPDEAAVLLKGLR